MAVQLDLFESASEAQNNEQTRISARATGLDNDQSLERTLPPNVGANESGPNIHVGGAGGGGDNAPGDGPADALRLDRVTGMGEDEGRENTPESRAARRRRLREGGAIPVLGGDGSGVEGSGRGGAAGRRIGGAGGNEEVGARNQNNVRGAGVVPGRFDLRGIDIASGGKKEKFRNNVLAIETLRDLEGGDGIATAAQQRILANYVGWGGLQEAFKRPGGGVANGWNQEVFQLESLLNEKELDAAKASTTDAHYTSQEVVGEMWKALSRMGFTGGKVLEPACGTGNFVGMMPPAVAGNSLIHGIELDDLTARIAQNLYPDTRVHHQGFEESNKFDPLPGSYELAVGNPPFGAQRVFDAQHRDFSNHSIHNYFLLKSLNAVRENGVVAMVISRYFMDAENDKARLDVSKNAQLLGAVRLPNTAFLDNAGTSVTSDIVFFRKYTEAERVAVLAEIDAGEIPAWVGLGEVPDENPEAAAGSYVAVNSYFENNPEQFLGRWGSFGATQFGMTGALLPREGDEPLAVALENALERLPENSMPVPNEIVIPAGDLDGVEDADIGGYFVSDNRIYIRQGDVEGGPLASIAPIKPQAQARVRAYIELRDSLADLISAELADSGADLIEELRGDANGLYDEFRKYFGRLGDRANKSILRFDSSWSKVFALEDWADPAKVGARPVVTKAAILSERTIFPNQPPSKVDNALDALASSLSRFGRIDMVYMADISSISEEGILAELGDHVYELAQGEYETAEAFLSGNVKQKLKDMRVKTLDDERYERNVIALEAVQPADIPATEIEIKLGSHYMPDSDMSEFMKLMTGDNDASAKFKPVSGKWALYGRGTEENEMKWATKRKDLKKLIKAGIEQNNPVVYDKLDDGQRVTNQVETAKANTKLDLIKAEFRRWVFADIERRERLVGIYNDRFNTHVDSKYDGSHLTFPGKVSDDIVKLHDYQIDAVWRMISSGNPTLLYHAVGAGKTYTMIAASQEMKRLGSCSKPMIVVPNHLISQWASEFSKLYPSARVLVPEKKDFQKANREKLYGRIALGNWDAVIVAQSSFDIIRPNPVTEQKFLEELIREYEIEKEEIGRDRSKHYSVKDTERALKAHRARLEKLISTPRDNSYYFDELGVDALFVDESQEYKNLDYTTSLSRIAGIGSKTGSQKAMKMFLKSRHVLEVSGGKNLVFASGTPISNSIPEMYVLQKFLDFDRLKKTGLSSFDSWARMYGEITYEFELTATHTFKQISRFSKFINMPELLTSIKVFSDIRSREMIEKGRMERGIATDIPAIVGGEPKPAIANRSDIQEKEIDKLCIRADRLSLPDNMLAVLMDARKIALDPRILIPHVPDFEGSKVALAAEKITEIYDKWEEKKGTQLVFLDLSVPKPVGGGSALEELKDLQARAELGESAAMTELSKMTQDEINAAIVGGDFSVYEDLRSKLITNGVNPSDIEFVHSAKTDEQKRKLFSNVRSGNTRILFGSTSRLGAGVNVQERLVALHHLDCPWRPSDIEQREGRILRPGNMLIETVPGFEVEILRWATEKSVDSVLWQKQECKASFIQQIFDNNESGSRTWKDGNNPAQLAAEMKAVSSGDPHLLEDVQLSSEIQKLKLQERAYEQQSHELDYAVRSVKSRMESRPAIIDGLVEDTQQAQNMLPPPEEVNGKAPFFMRIGDNEYSTRKEAGNELIRVSKEQHAEGGKGTSSAIGEYLGFPMRLKISNEHIFDVTKRSFHVVLAGNYDHKTLTPIDAATTPLGIISSVHASVTKVADGALARTQAEQDSDERTLAGLITQKEERTGFPDARILAEKEAKSLLLKQQIATDRDKQLADKEKKKAEESKITLNGTGNGTGNGTEHIDETPPEVKRMPGAVVKQPATEEEIGVGA